MQRLLVFLAFVGVGGFAFSILFLLLAWVADGWESLFAAWIGVTLAGATWGILAWAFPWVVAVAVTGWVVNRVTED